MNKSTSKRSKFKLFRRSFRNTLRGISTAGEQLSILRQALRESDAADRELNDALTARLIAAESRLPSAQAAWMAEWSAIERSILACASKLKALRALYANLAAQQAPDAQAAATPAGNQSTGILIEIAPGELLDRLTILEIKLARIADPVKLKHVRHEYELTSASLARSIVPSTKLDALRTELKSANEALWDIEDHIRDHERVKDFGPSFIELARSVYRSNDRRAALKRQINEYLKSAIIEEKSYAPY